MVRHLVFWLEMIHNLRLVFESSRAPNVDNLYIYIPRTHMTHILEDLTHKMVPVNPQKNRSDGF